LVFLSDLLNEATPGTIRGDYAHMSQNHANEVGITVKNITHASGSPDEAKIELGLWFDQSEICRYDSVHDKHILG
jgi:nucleoside-diphosphate kinase